MLRLLSNVLLVTAMSGSALAQDVESSELPPILAKAMEPWSGDFDETIERSMIRVVIPVSLTSYFPDGAVQKGPTYELVQQFEKYLKEALGKAATKLTLVVIPGRRDRIFDMVIDGRADIAAGLVTVTEERAKRVDFSAPFVSGVNEVVVTKKGLRQANTLDDLVGIPIHVRKSTSFWGTLDRVNETRKAAGAEPLTVVAVDEHLRTEDLLEMVGAGVLPATVADSLVASMFARVFEGLTIQDQVPLAEGQSYAWAFRKGDTKMNDAISSFAGQSRKGTLLGNVILNKYVKNVDWIRDVYAHEGDRKLTELRDLFRTYSARYGFDWLIIAAQAYQESQLDQSKRSPVGAVGLMQLMPATAADPSVDISQIELPEANIHAGVKYLNLLRTRYFNDPNMSALDRELFCFAAYNAGPGNVSKARKRASALGFDPNTWFENVEIAMGQAVSNEPVVYVRNIFKYYIAFKLINAEQTTRTSAQ